MSKRRVYEIAKELGVESKELVQRIRALGIPVSNHMSTLEDEQVERIKQAFGRSSQRTTETRQIRPTVVRRRTVGDKKVEEKVVASPRPGVVVRRAAAKPSAVAGGGAVGRSSSTAPSAAKAPAQPSAAKAPAQPSAEAKAPAQPSAAKVPAQPSAAKVPARPAPAKAPARPAPAQAPAQPTSGSTPEPVAVSAPEASRPEPAPSQPARTAVAEATHAHLPPGVVARGKQVGRSAAPLPESVRSRIVSEHQKRRPEPRRREVGRAALGPVGRPAGRMGRPGRRKRVGPRTKGKSTEITVPSAQKRKIRIEEAVQVQTLAQRMGIKAAELLMKLMELGMAGVHINSTLDADTAKILASEFGYEVEDVARSEEEIVEDARGSFEDREEDRVGRHPVVTVMGHVDHGKTSLLDKIRKSRVAAQEAGGITQHIGASRVTLPGKGTVVFLDTPGHEAFTSMRARGAQATDVVILVVAADDGVMPQTKEAISHAKAAGVPIVVAINKIDKPEAQPDRVMTELSAEGLQPEAWGGETIFVQCSAMTGQGIDELLEAVLLQAEVLELMANPKIPAEGIVLEAYLDRGRGPVANVLIRDGSLRRGDYVVAGHAWGRVRAMMDEHGKQVKEAGPSTPVELLGLSEVPSAGDKLFRVTDQRKAEEVAKARKAKIERPSAGPKILTLEQMQQLMQQGEVKELKVVVKADVQGSVEALQQALQKLSTEKVRVNIIHAAVGGITENDVMLASAAGALVIGFNVRPQGQAGSTAKREQVEIRTYRVIYDAVDDIRDAMAGLLAPKQVEKDLGRAEVREVFHIPKVGTVAGCMVLEGKLARNARARLVRDGIQLWDGEFASLRRFKDDVKEVAAGFECGVGLKGYQDIKERDVIEAYEIEEVKAEL